MDNTEEQTTNLFRFVFDLYKDYSLEIEEASYENVLSREQGVLKRAYETITPRKWITEIKTFLTKNPTAAISKEQCKIFIILINDDKDQESTKYEKLKTLIFRNCNKEFKSPAEQLKAAKEFDEYFGRWFKYFYKVHYLNIEKELSNCITLESVFNELEILRNNINYSLIIDRIMSLYQKSILCQSDEKSDETFIGWFLNTANEAYEISQEIGFEDNEINQCVLSLYWLFLSFDRLLKSGNFSLDDFRKILCDIVNSHFNKTVMLDCRKMFRVIGNSIYGRDSSVKYELVIFPTREENKFSPRFVCKNKKNNNQGDGYYNNLNNNEFKKQKKDTENY